MRTSADQQNNSQVQHRYKDFDELNEKLHKEIAIAKDLLPGKKIIKNSKFLEQRRLDLESYLQTVSHIVQHQIPLDFVEFLEFHRYDVVFLLQKLAMKLSRIVNDTKQFTFTILEVITDGIFINILYVYNLLASCDIIPTCASCAIV